MRLNVTVASTDVEYLGWMNGRCLKRMTAIPQDMGVGEHGSALFLLADGQALYQLDRTVPDFDVKRRLLILATQQARPVGVLDAATNDILSVDEAHADTPRVDRNRSEA